METLLEPEETAGVAVPPPLLFAGPLVLGIALGRIPGAPERGPAIARGLGSASIVAGAGLGVATLRTLHRAKTAASPYRPATALVTGGVYRWTRNPAYVAATSLYVGVALRARSVPAFVLLPIVLALLDRAVVDPEERYLERRFGERYRAYRARTPRWF